MDRTKKDISLLEHIIEHCSELAETRKLFGDNYEEFQKNKPYFKAVTMDLFQIGELANHLSEKLTEKYSDIAWVRIIGLRNIIAHGYGVLEISKIWEVCHKFAPELQKRCQEIIKEIEK